MTCNPRVSVVIIFLNEEKFLRQAIDSVLAQTYTNWEPLVVDDSLTGYVLSNLAVVHNRYQSRVVWLIPLLGALTAVGAVREHRRQLYRGNPE